MKQARSRTHDALSPAAQIERVRQMCLALAGASEKLSHGEPTFFVGKKVFVMFANNHHGDGHVAVWLPVPLGLQTDLIAVEPSVFFRPPYVGGRGWVGIELSAIDDAALRFHIQTAWDLTAPRKLKVATNRQTFSSRPIGRGKD